METAKDYLIALYLEWLNNFASLSKFAEHHGLTISQANELIKIARVVFDSNHPDN